ncbi:MAG TPA: hypothetical protein VFH73_18280 [Polyangia bacterium]|nr:hypothetical protein [Polyangia bacterium]
MGSGGGAGQTGDGSSTLAPDGAAGAMPSGSGGVVVSGQAGSGGDSGGGGGGSAGADGDAGSTDAVGADAPAPDAFSVRDAGMEALRLPPPVATWQEHWFEHNQLLTRFAYNDDVAIYVDNDVDKTMVGWMLPFATSMWQYTRKTYGEFGTEGRLYLNFHQGRYNGAHSDPYLRMDHDFRNVTDSGPGPWPATNFDLFTFEVGRIVEGGSNGVQGAATFNVWRLQTSELYQYDLYLAMGRMADAKRVFDVYTAATQSFPRAGTFWFRDWFYPIWRDHGRIAVMVKYFKLLSQYFPKTGAVYARQLTFGEMVHFMSGATNVNLKALATTAFGWPPEYDQQFTAARAAFPQVTY